MVSKGIIFKGLKLDLFKGMQRYLKELFWLICMILPLICMLVDIKSAYCRFVCMTEIFGDSKQSE